MSEKKLVEVATSLLLFKIQFDRRYNSVTEIIESEQWEEYERLKGSVDNGIMLAGKIREKLLEIKEIIN